MRNVLLVSLFLGVTTVISAQDVTIMEPFAEDIEQVTARSMGVAGSFGAVGADFSSATHNPAGVAFFRKKELGLSIGYHEQNNDVEFLNNTSSTKEGVLRLNNIAYAYSNLQTEWIGDSLAVKRDGLVGWTITAGMNQKSELKEKQVYNGLNSSNSLLTSYVETANQYAQDGIGFLDEFEQQAYQLGLLSANQSGNSTLYSSDYAAGGLLQSGTITREGAKRDFYLAGGMNFDNQLYVGATLGIPYHIYNHTSNYTEEDVNNTYSGLREFGLLQESEYSAVGGYLGIGAVYRFTDYIRAGIHVKSPTVLEVDENSVIATQKNQVLVEQPYESNYSLSLPWKAGLQFVASHPNYGLLSIEGDFVDYQSTSIDYDSELGETTAEEKAFNDGIDNLYKGAFNVRGGLEYRLLQTIRLRGGVAYYGSPYEHEADEFGANYDKKLFALGVGYRIVPANITIDIGFNHMKDEEFNSAYLVNNQPNEILTNSTSNQFRLSISKRWNQ